MAYPAAVHSEYRLLRGEVMSDPRTFVLLRSEDLDLCRRTVRRQLRRQFGPRDARWHEDVIPDRFECCRTFPAMKVVTMRPPEAVAAELHLFVTNSLERTARRRRENLHRQA